MANSFLTKNNDLEKFILIWLDASVNDPENRTTQDDLCQLTDNFQTFNNPNECELYIETHSNNERIVLITSGRFARQIISRIHEINSIFSIYIYCYDKTAYQQYAAEYPKIRDILITKAELIERICQDNKKQVHVINKELLSLNISTDGQFLQSQLLIHHLLKIETISANHHEEFFQLYQAASTENNNNFDDFQRNYSSQNSLQWLIKDSFFSKFFTQALQTKTIDVLYATQIQYKILFEIDADPSVQSLVPFADITSINHSKEQSDVLFMIGSIFRIEDVYQQNDICICRMTLCGECDPELKYLFDRIEKEDQNGSILSLGNLLIELDHVELGSTYHNIGALNWCQGMYDEAMKYYNLSLENKMKYFSSKHSSVAMTLENIGLIYENKGQFEQAFDYYKQAADSYEESLSSTHSDVIQIHENIQRITIHLNSKTSL
ncbi:hypothetical protein I4U23_019294 [Adineta vaga]|nr:hypothetical protein I4U23_019294 [Adineta vaga]